MYGNVVVGDIDVEKRLSFNRARRNKELTRKYHGNKKRCTEDNCRAKDSVLKLILDPRLDSHQVEPEDHSALF